MDMDQPENQMNNTSNTPPTEPTAPQSEDHGTSFGPLIGIIIIVALIVFGGFYYWLSLDKENDGTSDQTAEEIINQEDPQIDALEQQSTSDTVSAIEEDLDATDLGNIEADLEQIDQELGL